MTVRFLAAARDELRDAVRFYERQRPGLGAEFRDEVRSAVERIQALPDAWPSLGGDIRRCRTRTFPYAAIYRAGDEILVLAVAHLHREPGHWRDRI